MANRESRVDLILKARAEGLQQLQAQTDQFAKSMSQALDMATKGFGATNASLQKFGQSFSQVSKTVAGGLIATPTQAGISAFGQPSRFMPSGGGWQGGAGGFGGRPPGMPPGGGGGPGGTGAGGGWNPGDKLQIDLGPVVEGLEALKEGIGKLLGQAEKQTEKHTEAQQKHEDSQKKLEGTFAHGFLQTTLPTVAAPFLARGPGMMREAFGQMAGQALSGIAGGLGSMPLSGMAGLQQAISAVPIPGAGMVGGLLGAGAQFSQMSMQRHRARLEAAPWVQAGGESVGPWREHGGRAEWFAEQQGEKERLRTAPTMVGPMQRSIGGMKFSDFKRLDEKGQAELYSQYAPKVKADLEKQYRDWQNLSGQRQRATRAEEAYEGGAQIGEVTVTGSGRRGRSAVKLPGEEDVFKLPEKWKQEKKAQVRAKELSAAERARWAPWGMIKGAGMEYGMTEPESLQSVTQALQVGGGGVGQMQQQGMLSGMMAAKRTYGVDEGTSGAFLRAGRRGGLAGLEAGTERGGGEALAGTIGDAMKLGLEGSEINEYLKITAEGIQQFQQTGIPFPKDAFSGMGDELAKMGVSGPRGTHVVRGLTQAAQALSTRGPQNAAELMMMQTMGGYQGGGAEGFEAAQLQLEQGKMDPKNMQKLFGRFMQAGGGGAQGRMLFRNVMGGMGVQIGVKESQLMEAQMSGTLTGSQEKELSEIQANRDRVSKGGGAAAMGAPKGLEGMLAQSRVTMDQFGSVVKAQTAVQEKQAEVGEKLVGSMLKLELSTAKMAEGITSMVNPAVDWLAQAVFGASDAVEKFGRALGKAQKNAFGAETVNTEAH